MTELKISNKSLAYIRNNIDAISNDIPPGHTEFIFDETSAMYLRDAYQAVDLTAGGWNFMTNESPPNNKGYTFWDNITLKRIEVNMKYINVHDRGTFGSIMSDMRYIALNSWKSFVRRRIEYILDHDEKNKNLFLNNLLNLMGVNEGPTNTSLENIVNNSNDVINEMDRLMTQNPDTNQLEAMADAFESTSNVSDRVQQANALRQFSRGDMDYATMRSFCG